MKTIALAFAVAIATPVIAQSTNPLESANLMKKAVNDVGIAYTFYGQNFTKKVVKDAQIPGEQYVRVDVTQKGAHPWDIGAQYAVDKPIKPGDVVFFAVYARAPNLKDGESIAISGVGVGQTEAPYASIAMTEMHLTNQWNVYYASAKTTAGAARGQARASLQLAGDKQVIDLGPVIVLDLGPDYDMTTLPHN
jgi:hypothetical protein